jgi:hypothetical protein
MKTMTKENKANKKLATKHFRSPETEELKTDPPLSEKDEVKKAERRLQNKSK